MNPGLCEIGCGRPARTQFERYCTECWALSGKALEVFVERLKAQYRKKKRRTKRKRTQ